MALTGCYTNYIDEPLPPSDDEQEETDIFEGVDSVSQHFNVTYDLQPDAHLYTVDDARYILNNNVLDYLSSTVIFSPDMPDDKQPYVGESFMILANEKAPFGVMGTVTDVQKALGGIKVDFTRADYTDIFYNLDMDVQVNAATLGESMYYYYPSTCSDQFYPEPPEAGTLSRKKGGVAGSGGIYLELKKDGDDNSFTINPAISKDFKDDTGASSLERGVKVSGNAYLTIGCKTLSRRKVIRQGQDVSDEMNFLPYLSMGAKAGVEAYVRRTFETPKADVVFVVITPVGIPVAYFGVQSWLELILEGRVGVDFSVGKTFSFPVSVGSDLNLNFGHVNCTGQRPALSGLKVEGGVYGGIHFAPYVGLLHKDLGVGADIEIKAGVEAHTEVDLLHLDMKQPVSIDGVWEINASVYPNFILENIFTSVSDWKKSFFRPKVLLNGSVPMMPVMPEFEDMAGVRAAKSRTASVTWFQEFALLNLCGCTTGMNILEPDQKTIFKSIDGKSMAALPDKKTRMSVTVSGLDPDKQYYAQPYISYWGLKITGEPVLLGTTGNRLSAMGKWFTFNYDTRGRLSKLTNYISAEGSEGDLKPEITTYTYSPRLSVLNSQMNRESRIDENGNIEYYWVQDFVSMTNIELNNDGTISRCSLMDNEDIGMAYFTYDDEGHLTSIRTSYPGESDLMTLTWDDGCLMSWETREGGELVQRINFAYELITDNYNAPRQWSAMDGVYLPYLTYSGLVGPGPNYHPTAMTVTDFDTDGNDVIRVQGKVELNALKYIKEETLFIDGFEFQIPYAYKAVNTPPSMGASRSASTVRLPAFRDIFRRRRG